MEAFNIFAKLTLETNEFNEGLESAGNKADIFTGVLNANLVTKGINVAISAFKELAKVAADVFKDALSSQADYEQLIGGIKKLYGDAWETVATNADEAYKSMGLSANDYMETLMGFSSMLIDSASRGAQQNVEELEATLDAEYTDYKRYLEDQYDETKKYWDSRIEQTDSSNKDLRDKLKEQRDDALKELKRANEDDLLARKEHNKQIIAEAERTNQATDITIESQQKAADLANMIMEDMADNAATFGTSMDEVRNVYQSLAKGMYTTLDNLKLPFAGTKQGMQDLINKANDLRGSNDLTIDSFEDIAVAIHTVQQEMKITGTAANEASGTISGSVNAVKAAWNNLKRGLGDENADIEKLMDDLAKACKNAWEKIEPVAKRILGNMWEAVKEFIPKFGELGLEIGWEIIKGILKAPIRIIFDLLKALGIWDAATALGSTLTGAVFNRANGGTVLSDKPYIAGEIGPELIIPSTTSHVYTADETRGMLGSDRAVTININGDVYDDEYSMKRKLENAMLDVLQGQMAYG